MFEFFSIKLYTYSAVCLLIDSVSNKSPAIKIAFINEMADICEKTGANIKEIAKAMGMDKRISPYFLQAGPGIGGSCFPKDSIALANIGKNLDLDMELVSASVNSNIKRKKRMADKIINNSNCDLKGKVVSLLGLTFKANTDDTRYSPAIDIITKLTDNGIFVKVYADEDSEDYTHQFNICV